MSTNTKKQPTTATATPATDIHGHAMLVRITISLWSGRRLDRKVSAEVSDAHHSDRSVGNYHKHVLGGRKAEPAKLHTTVLNLGHQLRVTFAEQTLPWSDDNWRLLPTSNFFAFGEMVRNARNEFDTAVKEFVDAYPTLQEDAKVALNSLYNEDDYPSVDQMRRKFGVLVQFSPIPAKGDFRVELPAEQVATIERDTEDRVTKAVAAAMQDAWGRLHDVVARVQKKLAEPEGIFRDSLIKNVAEVTDILSRLNVTQDPTLEDLRKRVILDIAGLDPDNLREDTTARQEAVKKAQHILDAMKGVYGGAV